MSDIFPVSTTGRRIDFTNGHIIISRDWPDRIRARLPADAPKDWPTPALDRWPVAVSLYAPDADDEGAEKDVLIPMSLEEARSFVDALASILEMT